MGLRNKKTGEIVDLSIFGITLNIRKEQQPTYHSIEQLCEEWEDVDCTNDTNIPLIKDEKIRKAVRVWAEANDVEVARVAPFAVFDIETSARTFFYSRVIEDKYYDEEKTYTITELCGEEK